MKIVSIIVFLFCQNLFSQVDFKCVIESKAIYPNDKFKISFVSNDYIDEFVSPNFEKLGFKVIGGQGRSQSNVFENGKKTIVSEVFYFLTASKKGIYTIEKSKMESNGAIYFSKPINVAILDDSKTDDTFNDFFLFAEQEKEHYLVNEPIALVYKLFYNNRIKICRVIRYPYSPPLTATDLKLPKKLLQKRLNTSTHLQNQLLSLNI